MSAAALVLPLVWATAQTGNQTGLPSESQAELQPGSPHSFTSCRKGPHALRLVQPSPPSPRITEPVPTAAPVPELAFYRKFTEKLLERYLRMSFEAGRVPSLMGRELFRGNVSHTVVTGFDDVVHFIADVEKCLRQLSRMQQTLLKRIAMYGYTQSETSAMTGVSLRTVVRRYYEALDRLTGLLMEADILQPNNARKGDC